MGTDIESPYSTEALPFRERRQRELETLTQEWQFLRGHLADLQCQADLLASIIAEITAYLRPVRIPPARQYDIGPDPTPAAAWIAPTVHTGDDKAAVPLPEWNVAPCGGASADALICTIFRAENKPLHWETVQDRIIPMGGVYAQGTVARRLRALARDGTLQFLGAGVYALPTVPVAVQPEEAS